jgi:hypothetical protein
MRGCKRLQLRRWTAGIVTLLLPPSLSAILGGGIAPSLLAGLIGPDVAAKWYFVPSVYGIYCVVAMASLLFIRESSLDLGPGAC